MGFFRKKISPQVIGLIALYGAKNEVDLIEASVTIPSKREILCHKVWFPWSQSNSLDENGLADAARQFCIDNGAEEIQVVQELLPPEAHTGNCSHCLGTMPRVPWT